MARFEIWSHGRSSRRLSVQDIFLEKEEVRLHLLQSLHRRSKWTVQFPITISPDLRHLSILRTVYWLESEKRGSELVRHAATLDLNLNIYSSRMWAESFYNKTYRDDKSRSALYVYWIRFSKSGKEIFFMDRRNVAVFTMRPSAMGGPSLTAVCINAHNYTNEFRDNVSWATSHSLHAEDDICDDDEGLSWTMFFEHPPEQQNSLSQNREPMQQLDVQFHPSKPLVAYRTGRYVFLWAYKDCETLLGKQVFNS